MSKRRKFTKEFKQEAAGLVEEPGVSCAQIARDLGINANMLSRWRRELAVDDRRAFRGNDSPAMRT
ncbi:MAG: transposase [Arenicellales bacterium]